MNPWMLWLGWIRVARVIGFSIAGSLLLTTCAPAQVTFNVNSFDDGVDADVTDGKCEIPVPAPPNTCTLRAAVMQANRMVTFDGADENGLSAHSGNSRPSSYRR